MCMEQGDDDMFASISINCADVDELSTIKATFAFVCFNKRINIDHVCNINYFFLNAVVSRLIIIIYISI